MAGFLGSGIVYHNRKVAGVDQGWKPFGNATKLEIKENSEQKERISKQKATYGQLLDSVSVKQPAEISIELDDLNKENLALAFLGDVSAINVTGASVTDEAVTGNHEASFQTAQRNISNIVLTNSAATTTYVLDTDYQIENAAMGLIKVLASGSITEGQALLVDYDYGNLTGNKISGGTNSSIKVALIMDGENFADQSAVEVEIFEAVISPENGVDFLADDFATVTLTGTLNTPTGKTSPYEVNTDVVRT